MNALAPYFFASSSTRSATGSARATSLEAGLAAHSGRWRRWAIAPQPITPYLTVMGFLRRTDSAGGGIPIARRNRREVQPRRYVLQARVGSPTARRQAAYAYSPLRDLSATLISVRSRSARSNPARLAARANWGRYSSRRVMVPPSRHFRSTDTRPPASFALAEAFNNATNSSIASRAATASPPSSF